MIPIVKRLCATIRPSCLALALCLFAPGLPHAAPASPVFILHSYSQEYAWTRGQHEGFIQTLAADEQVNVIVGTEYLDAKRRAYDETYAGEMARHLRSKYAGYKPAAIYVTDDDALLFARDHLSRLFPGVPVFFSGVNDYSVRSSLDPALFTGVFERKEVGPNIEWLLRVDKDANDLIFIGDGSNTDQAIEGELRSELIPYRLRTTFIAEKRLKRALERLSALPGKYIFLTTLGGMTDENGQVLPLRDIMKGLTGAGRIVISMEDAYIIEGVLGGSVTSGQKQGVSAARLLLANLHGKPISDLPPILKSPNALIFDDRVLERHGIDLPGSLRSQAVLLHPRPGFYERYRPLILGMLVGLAVLLFLVVSVSLMILSRKNRELSLAQNTAESANALFNQLAEQSRTVHWEVNAEGVYTYVSPVSHAVLGYRPEELVGRKRFYDLLHDGKLDVKKTAVFECFVRKETFHDLESAIQTRDGRRIWVSTNGFPLLDGHGAFLGYRGSDGDITVRKQAGKQLESTLERLRKAVGATIQVLASAVETRDPYTAGHQIRSADLARAIAAEMGLPQNQIDGVRMAGSIHDIGKLSVPAEILSKPTKLSDLEFSLIKEHAVKGFEMLKDVQSPWPLAEIVYQHHERMDGSGYPRRLKGEEILMEARILVVADVVESMASHRPYRPALGIEAALDEISKNSGILYDSTVADACRRLFLEKGFKLSS